MYNAWNTYTWLVLIRSVRAKNLSKMEMKKIVKKGKITMITITMIRTARMWNDDNKQNKKKKICSIRSAHRKIFNWLSQRGWGVTRIRTRRVGVVEWVAESSASYRTWSHPPQRLTGNRVYSRYGSVTSSFRECMPRKWTRKSNERTNDPRIPKRYVFFFTLLYFSVV